MGDSESGHRLPTRVRPTAYRLAMRVDPRADGFSGEVHIDVVLDGALDEIVLHAKDLEIHSATVLGPDGNTLVAELDLDEAQEQALLRMPGEVGPGTAELHLVYSASYCKNLVGLYNSEFDVGDSRERLAVSQCESTHARRILPCFDEPGFKATWELTLEVPRGLTAVSNGAEVSRTPVGRPPQEPHGTTPFDEVRFAPTIPMSSYLLAVVVGPLEVTEAPDVPGRNGPIPLRVVHPPGKGGLTGFSVEVATAALGFFEDYYDIPYPGDKVDLVAIPDFAFGAMENHGCITFREVLLLVDPQDAAPLELQRVADVVNHELAHMWFGNLVTMRWWNGIWLNEAFATFMETSASDSFRPEWDVWTTFGLARSAAFDTDALHSTRPIEFEVDTAAEAEAMFDILTYEKGASVLRMIEQYLGPEAFRGGIRSYLREHSYGNTETSDLWRSLESATGEPVRRVAESWILRGGHPLVHVECAEGSTEVRLRQERALYGDAREEAAEEPYPVPMTLATSTASDAPVAHRLILEGPETVALGSAPEVVRTNPGGSGFFRSLLPAHHREAVLSGAESPLERYVVLDDTWFGVMTGHLAPAEMLSTIEALVGHRESEPPLWRRVVSVLAELERLLDATRREELASWCGDAMAVMLERFAPLTSGGRDAEVAASVLVALATTGRHGPAIELAAEVFGQTHGPGSRRTAAEVHSAVAAAALDVVARRPTEEQYRLIQQRWRAAETPQDEQRHLAALVATAVPQQFAESLGLCLSEVRSQDAPYTLRRALANLELGTAAWDFVAGNYPELCEMLPAGSLPRMLEGIRSFTDRATALRVQEFLSEHPEQGSNQQVRQHIERMWASVAVAERFAASTGALTGDH